MDNKFVIVAHVEHTQHRAILVDDGVVGILYLHALSDDPETPGDVLADCFAYNRIDPIDVKDVRLYRPNPPPIAKAYASNLAVCVSPELHCWELKFAADGRGAMLLRDNAPWAIVSIDAPRGLSKAIEAGGPWGNPWSCDVYESTEWEDHPARLNVLLTGADLQIDADDVKIPMGDSQLDAADK